MYHLPGSRGPALWGGGLLLRDRNASLSDPTKWATETAGVDRAERVYQCADHKGDIVALVKATGNTYRGELLEQDRYSPSGVPFGVPVGDLNSDGVVDSTDSSIQSTIAGGTYQPRADVNLDGKVDSTDAAVITAASGNQLARMKLSLASTRSSVGTRAAVHYLGGKRFSTTQRTGNVLYAAATIPPASNVVYNHNQYSFTVNSNLNPPLAINSKYKAVPPALLHMLDSGTLSEDQRFKLQAIITQYNTPNWTDDNYPRPMLSATSSADASVLSELQRQALGKMVAAGPVPRLAQSGGVADSRYIGSNTNSLSIRISASGSDNQFNGELGAEGYELLPDNKEHAQSVTRNQSVKIICVNGKPATDLPSGDVGPITANGLTAELKLVSGASADKEGNTLLELGWHASASWASKNPLANNFQISGWKWKCAEE